MSRRSTAHLLEALGTDLGIAGLHLDDEGRCTLAFDDVRVTFEFDEQRGQVFLYAGLGILPADAPAALLERLLGANLFWRGTGGATLGLDEGSRRLVLVQAVASDTINETAFRAVVERFVATAETWMGRAAEPPGEKVEAMPMLHPGMFV